MIDARSATWNRFGFFLERAAAVIKNCDNTQESTQECSSIAASARVQMSPDPSGRRSR
jgi:hypothetical protein